jgi:hypothetical protein
VIGALPGLTSVFVIYQDPLAYLLGIEGIALLDAWAGDHDREFTQTRLAEIRRLQDDEKLRDRGVLAGASAPSPPTSSSLGAG